MKIGIALLMAVLLIPALATASPAVNGEFRIIDGIRVLHVWGSHYEMGYAHGYFLAEDIVELFDDIFVPLVGSLKEWQDNRDQYESLYAMPDWHGEETQGLVDGIADAGANLYIKSLDRDLDVNDLGMMDALSDIRTIYECASFAAWGDATITDPVLLGESALSRNLDWWTPWGHPYLLARNTVVIGREPDDARATLMVGFSGLSGCYSCMNDAGVATTRMMSNHGTPARQMDYSRLFTPLNIVMREALEAADVDGDAASTVNDVATALEESVRSSAYNIMIVGPASAGIEPVVAEINNRQFALRTSSDSSELPPAVLAATNHMRKMYPAIPDSRYAAMRSDVLDWNGEINLSRMWEVLQSMYDEWLTGATTQSMIFVPFNRSLAISFTDEEALAPFKQPTWLAWDEIFGLGDDDADDDSDDDAGDDDTGWLSDDDVAPADDDDAVLATTDDDAGSDGACGC